MYGIEMSAQRLGSDALDVRTPVRGLLLVSQRLAGLVGVLLSLTPRVRGGMISIFSVVAGVIGIVAAVFKLVF